MLFRSSLEDAAPLPDACTACGRCAEVCPAAIPLPDLLRDLRAEKFRERITPARWRLGLRIYGWLTRHPALYRRLTGIAVRVMHALGSRDGVLRRLPLAGGWLSTRDLPAPQEPRTFLATVRARKQSKRRRRRRRSA